MQPKGSEDWVIAATTKTCEGTVTGLAKSQEYLFRVSAFNEKGRSDPRPLAAPVTAKDITIEPSFKITCNTFSVQCGEDLKVEIPVKGRPAPKVTWTKDGQALKETTRLNVSSTATATILSIKDANREDCGKYTITAANTVGTPEAIVITRSLVTIQWTKPQYDGGSVITGYLVERKKLPDGRWMKASFTNIIDTQFTITDLTEGDRYEFRVIARNAAGILSEPSESTGPITAQDEIEAPSISMESKFKDVIIVNAGDTFTIDADIAGKPLPDIMWLKDGKEIDSATPRMEIKSTITRTILTVKDCIRVDGGHFVLSLSNVGGTKQVPVNVKVLDRPGPPDGPLKVTGVRAEKCRPHPEVVWKKDAHSLKQTTRVNVLTSKTSSKIVIKDATREDSGKYEITLTNSIGSKSAEITVILVVVKAGEILRIDAEISGRPLPVISWTKDGKEIDAKARVEISSTLTTTTLIVKECIRRDSGQYVLTLQNVAGTRSIAVNCKVLDRPGPSSGPLDVTGLTAEKCTLTWGPPQENGGAEIQHYIVEKRETSRLAWTLVYADMKATTCKVTKLLKGNEYIFRVRGVNKYGTGEALESDAVKALDPFTVAAAPTCVEVTNVTSEAMTICWERPVSDGGSSISGYVIEKREKSGLRWVRVNKKPVYDLRVKASNLREGCEYEYRVYAENAAGLSKPSTPCPLTKAEDPLFLPSPPAKPKIIDSTKTTITLTWNKPLFDGGSPVTGYSVEYRKTNDEDWVVGVGHTKNTEFTVVGLTSGTEYVFVVKSINKIGPSEPSPESDPQIAKDREDEPVFLISNEMRKTLIVKDASPLLGVNLSKMAVAGSPVTRLKLWRKDSRSGLNAVSLKQLVSLSTV
uniref:Titin n=1 Tax=Astyanax mexicanus TaxID=7994 RepID=A0A8B9LPH6_ASTMX